ncbi:MAG: hypothetical protein ACLR01_08225 [Vescimonas sp.]
MACFCCSFRSWSSWAKISSACCWACRTMRLASASPLARALSLPFSICSRKVRAFRESSSRCRHSRSASFWAFSSRWRFSSSWVSTSSKRTESLSIWACAA